MTDDVTFPLRYAASDPSDFRRWYQLEIVKNPPFIERSGQPAYTLVGKLSGYTTDDAADERQLGAQCWLLDHDALGPRTSLAASVVFDSDEEIFMVYCEDLEPLLELVTLLRTEIDGPPDGAPRVPRAYDPDGAYTEAWAAMLRRESQKLRIVR